MDLLKPWRGRRVLITGGAGFLGRHLCALGVQAGVEVHILSLRGNPVTGVQHHQANLAHSQETTALVQRLRPDAIIHAAAGGVGYGSSSFQEAMQVNTVGFHALLEGAASLENPPPVVVAGSGFEYASRCGAISEDDPLQPTSYYGVSKAAAWMVAQLYARRLAICWLRLFSLYGPGERTPRLAPYIIESALAGSRIELTGCEQLRDYVYAVDAAEAFWRALALSREPGSLLTLNIGTGEPVTLRQFVEVLGRILCNRGIVPELAFGAKPYRPDEPMIYVPDIARMQAVFGWKPATTLEDGLKFMVEQYLEQAGNSADNPAQTH